ncbi:MAG: ATP-grasp domain-containing protein [Gammaproteobacteria bacterium]|nr:ATP-grasp domain-containing protein [Gammaproteobacteria bacterium]
MSTKLQKLRRVLVANRGEIAIRIAKSATSLDIESIGLFSSVDRNALHTRFTTSAVQIGSGNQTIEPYLDTNEIIRAAMDAECDSVHPGYGFLSESFELASKCEAQGILFVGPSSDALQLFGDKIAARNLANTLGIPTIPGSVAPVDTIDEAIVCSNEIGYPVMLKAAGGGGGKGMRVVDSDTQMTEAYDRCRNEAQSAFGNASLFIEKYLNRPRHIEVQVVADRLGQTFHFWERDCSVQLRNQKVVEIAPAPNLSQHLRTSLLTDAVSLAKAGKYLNAGTFEFLVVPETEKYFFIECNPRIQVEHTVTEQVTGFDLVEMQFQVASGYMLEELGLRKQDDVPIPKRFAVQARVVAKSSGQFNAYKEPSGAGIRVDSCGHVGCQIEPYFDPLFAKVICTGSPQGAVRNAIDKVRRSLDEFYVDGVSTNIEQLKSILGQEELQNGGARTTFLDAHPELLESDTRTKSSVAELYQRHSNGSPRGQFSSRVHLGESTGQDLSVDPSDVPVRTPMSGSIVEMKIKKGDMVVAGDPMLVVSAMKMESEVTAPSSGIVVAVQELTKGDSVDANQIVASIAPSSDEQTSKKGPLDATRSWLPLLGDIAAMRGFAEARFSPSSEDPGVVRQRDRGKLTCTERIELLLDDDSFREIGSAAGFASYDEEGKVSAFTPANHVGGWGTIQGRKCIVCADDFTSRGGHADGAIGAKSGYLDRLSLEMRVPSIRLLDGSSGGGSVAAMVPAQKKEGESKAKESTGAIKAGRPRVAGGGGSYLPGHLGSNMFAEQLHTVPVVNMLLGSVVGIGAAKAVLGHFSVMVRDIAQLFVAGPPVVSHAMGYDITKEDLGGWHIHCCNGSVDNLAETEEEAAQLTRDFLSYLPSSVYELPPIRNTTTDKPDRREDDLLSIIPRKRTSTFDIRRVINLLADHDSFFEIGSLWGTDQVTGFVRFCGHPMGVIASDSQHANGGALTSAGCEKLTRHLDLCDVFHLPLLNLVDNPGFAVGLEHEQTGTIRKGGEWMIAFAQTKIPIFTVLLRRSFGVAGNNYATPRSRPSMRVAWPAADVGGIPPEGGIEAAYKRQLAASDNPEALRQELMDRIETARGPVGPLSRFQIEELIDPRDTRRLVCEWIEDAYRYIALPDQLGPRSIQFRP